MLLHEVHFVWTFWAQVQVSKPLALRLLFSLIRAVPICEDEHENFVAIVIAPAEARAKSEVSGWSRLGVKPRKFDPAAANGVGGTNFPPTPLSPTKFCRPPLGLRALFADTRGRARPET